MSRVLAASLVPAAAAALLIPVGTAGLFPAAAVSGAILAVWSVGTAGAGIPGETSRMLVDRLTGFGFAIALAGGTLMATGVADGAALFGLPRSLWGLLLGVWLIPLLLTSAGFALSFRPPDAADLERLRAAFRRDA